MPTKVKEKLFEMKCQCMTYIREIINNGRIGNTEVRSYLWIHLLQATTGFLEEYNLVGGDD